MDQKNCSLTDQEMLSDALDSQKYITGNLNTFANECSTSKLRDDFLNVLQDEHNIQYELFNEMSQRGWYPVQQADQTQISQAKQKFDNMKSSFN